MNEYQTPPAPQPGPPLGPPGATPIGSESFFDSLRRSGLVRTDDRWIGGVAGGVARRFGWDPLLARGLFVVAAMIGGVGLILYGVAWALLPEERDGRIHLQQLVAGHFDIAFVGALTLVIVGLSGSAWSPATRWGGDGFGWVTFLALVGVGIAVLVTYANRPGPGPAPFDPIVPGATASGFTPGGPVPTTSPIPSSAPPGAPAPATAYPAYPTHPASPTVYPAATSGYPSQYPPAGRPPATPPASVPGPSGPGSRASGAVLGIALIVFAVVLIASRSFGYDGPVFLTAGAIALVVAGLAIVVAGVLGRTSGGIGGLAIAGIIVLVPVASVHAWSGDVTFAEGAVFGEVTSTPTSVVTAEAGLSVGAGEARLDLTEVPLGGETVEVPVGVGAGEVTILLPSDGAWVASVRVMAGEVSHDGEVLRSSAGNTQALRVESDAVADGAEPDLVVEIAVGAGTVMLEEVGR